VQLYARINKGPVTISAHGRSQAPLKDASDKFRICVIKLSQ
jgi:hypothetical protein